MYYEISLPIIEDLDGYQNVVYLTPETQKSHRDALEVMAKYFRREFKYDGLQYDSVEHDKDCVGILFCETAMDLVKDIDHYPNRVIGGACFWKTSEGDYFLDWVWFHPFARNRRNLKKAWPSFKKKFGNFTLTKSLSAHMEKFLEKHA